MKMRRLPQQVPLFDSLRPDKNQEDEVSSSVENNWLSTNGHNLLSETRGQRNDHSTSPVKSSLRLVQEQFNELHEELYKKGGVKPANAAIDEVGKLIFLKIHTEMYPTYRLHSGLGQGKLFLDIFQSSYIKANGRSAVRELQDAFQEISVLPSYTSYVGNEPQTIFPYQEAFRLEHPDVLAMAIDILSPLSLSVSDDSLLGNTQKQWETFSHQDLLGSAYDIFLRGRYDSAGGLGTYLTPGQVVDCMVRMAFCHISDQQLWARRDDLTEQARWGDQQIRDLPAFLMGDICCGTGRFLVRALAEVRNRVLNTPYKDEREKLNWLAQMKRYSFFGADQSASSIIKTRINFLLFGEPHAPLITVEDSILDERVDQLRGKFDLILTNPPFGDGKYVTQAGLEKMRRANLDLRLGWSWKAGKREKKPIQRADPALLFLDRNLQLLRPGGLLLIVLPDGILEPAYEYAHKYLLDKAELKAVVSLPRDTFAIAGTVAKTSFLFLQKRGEERLDRRTIYMAVADHVGFLKKGSVEVPDPKGDDLPLIASVYEDFVKETSLKEREELSHNPMIVAIPSDNIEDSLTAQTYHSDRLHAEIVATTLHKESRYLHELVTLVKPQQTMRSSKTSYFISVLHVDERSNVAWDAAVSYMPTSKGIRCYPNDIIFSCLNPAKIRVAVIPPDLKGEILCSIEFAVLHVKQGEDPYFIALALRTKTSQRQILPLAKGTSTSRRRVRNEDLLGIIIPYPKTQMRQEIAATFHNALEMARRALIMNCELLSVLENSSSVEEDQEEGAARNISMNN